MIILKNLIFNKVFNPETPQKHKWNTINVCWRYQWGWKWAFLTVVNHGLTWRWFNHLEPRWTVIFDGKQNIKQIIFIGLLSINANPMLSHKSVPDHSNVWPPCNVRLIRILYDSIRGDTPRHNSRTSKWSLAMMASLSLSIWDGNSSFIISFQVMKIHLPESSKFFLRVFRVYLRME